MLIMLIIFVNHLNKLTKIIINVTNSIMFLDYFIL